MTCQLTIYTSYTTQELLHKYLNKLYNFQCKPTAGERPQLALEIMVLKCVTI